MEPVLEVGVAETSVEVAPKELEDIKMRPPHATSGMLHNKDLECEYENEFENETRYETMSTNVA